jgi:hypothetical protein
MPALLRIVSKYLKPTPQVLNLVIVRVSLSLLFVGSILLAFATNSAFLIAGELNSFRDFRVLLLNSM